MAGRKLALRTPRGITLWAGLTGLFALGILTTLADMSSLPTREGLRATYDEQRLVFDATGRLISNKKPVAAKAFEVATPEKAKPVEAKPAEAKPAEIKEPAVETPHPAAHSDMQVATAPAAKAIELPTAIPAAEPAPTNLTELRTKPTAMALPSAAISSSKDSLLRAPAPEITEIIDHMAIPRRNEKLSASSLYAKRFDNDDSKPRVALVVMDAGLAAPSTALLSGLPKTVTIAFSPYARKSAANIEILRSLGFEIWGMVPAVGNRFPQDDPGPLGLLQTMPSDELLRRLREVMANTVGSVGLILPPDETLSERATAFSPVLAEIEARGLYLLSTNSIRPLAKLTADAKLRAILQRADMVLDPTPNEPQIKSKLASIPALAKEKERLIVVLSARPQSLALLQQWLSSNPEITVAPLSALYTKAAEPEPEAEPAGGHGAKPAAKTEGKSSPPADSHSEKKGH